MSFDSLGLAPELLRAIADEGYTSPTPIQAQAIPLVLAGHDLLAAAQTGTGKTAGFTLPILHQLMQQPHHGKNPRVLVLVPTRELAAQVAESVKTYGKNLPLRTAVIFGGVGMTPQIDAFRRGVDIVVATPGRLLDHMQQRNVHMGEIQMLVLDEADRMLDMGFIHDIKRVIQVLPKKRQNLMFSATFNPDIRRLAESFLHNPQSVEVAPRNTTAERINQRLIPVDKARKMALISHLVRQNNWHQVLVFTGTKHGANRLAEQLARTGITTSAIHGNKSQNARTKALADFKAGTVQVLVATDIAARGLDIEDLPHVINHELPNVPEDYVHRIGRTGRAGATGDAISLLSPDQRDEWRDIAKLIRRNFTEAPEPGFEPGTPPTAEETALRAKLADTEDRGPPPGGRGGRGRPQGRSGNGGGGARPSSNGGGAAPASRPSGNRPQSAGRSGSGQPQAAGARPGGGGGARPAGGRPSGGRGPGGGGGGAGRSGGPSRGRS